MKKFLLVFLVLVSFASFAQELKIGDPAPLFSLKNQEGLNFDLSSQKGKWTILYFYPKAGTPGCTAQAMAFRDELGKIKIEGVDVFGISTDSVEAQAKFKKDLDLNFTLLSDSEGSVSSLYGSKLFFLNYSKRWSFIIGPDLTLRFIERDVEAKDDAKILLQKIKELKGK